MYKTPVHYTEDKLRQFAIDDLLRDAEQAERQAEEGPFFPSRGITAESCARYAAECRTRAAAMALK